SSYEIHTAFVKKDANAALIFAARWHFLKWRNPLPERVLGNPNANKMPTRKKSCATMTDGMLQHTTQLLSCQSKSIKLRESRETFRQ
ncbi:MAG: hypothetical protein OXT74_07020, partial [Candidatus Poribacteria bacterium]|nr:hypothetical protein [Candidatus Poribacteria bacterium]